MWALAHRDASLKTAQLWLGYRVGSASESPGATGVAHLLEHLMFEGTALYPEFDAVIQKAGGSSNAFTGQDLTCYYESLPDANLHVALALESDRMRNAQLSDDKIEIQRRVVLEEYKERYINNPYGDVWHHLRALCFKNHPYAWPVIGRSLGEVAGLTSETIRRFHHQHYRPENAALVVVSPRCEEEVLEQAARYFEGLIFEKSDTGFVPSTSLSQSVEPTEREMKVERPVPDSMIYLAWRTPPCTEEDSVGLDVLAEWLGGSESSVLYRKYIRHQPLFTAVQAFQMEGVLGGLFLIVGRLSQGVSFEKAKNVLLQEVNRLEDNVPDPIHLRRVVKMARMSRAFDLTSPAARARRLVWFQTLLGDASLEARFMSLYEAASPEWLQALARKYLISDSVFVLEYAATQE
ncbi:MAG: insulinase family protein [Flavobacteriales bacterium]|nr:insulinase family protein [Flavobacteriales bacterium]MDW8432194.1 pitrilysin family protein [Flavobacteriales bacterium]